MTLPEDPRLQVSKSLGLPVIRSGRKYVLAYQIASSVALRVVSR